jgi:hypothetical protein
MENKFITQISGKDFITYEGLLNEFHKNGGQSITTELVSKKLGEETFFIFKATVSGERGLYEGHGDACKGNVNPMIVKHMMRMAETRAKARALRDYNNIGIAAAEELD